jgi:DNA-binding response OmpR family regulator
LRKILIVDDEYLTTKLLRTLLELEGFTIISTSDQQQVVEMVRAEHPDLVIMDVYLDDKDGLEILQVIRNKSSTPILMTSGLDRSDECLQAGANAFLLKPFNRAQLLKAIREAWRE